MPNEGEKIQAWKIGKKGAYLYEWVICPVCYEGRWSHSYNIKKAKMKGMCRHCWGSQRGEKHSNWTGGKYKKDDGYIVLLISLDDFFYPMADLRGYVLEHRLVIAKHLGRNLHRWEIVHHKGTRYPIGSKEDKGDNRIENLQLVSEDKHNSFTILNKRIKYLEKKLAEARTLIWELRRVK